MPGRRGLSYAGQVSPSAPDDDGMSVLQKHLAAIKRKAALQRAHGMQAPPGEAGQQIYQPFPSIRPPETPSQRQLYTSQDDMAKLLGFRMATVDPGETDMWKGMSTYTPAFRQRNIESNAPPPDPAFRQRLMQSDIYKQMSAPPPTGQGGTSFEQMMLKNPQQLDEATRRALLRNLQQSTADRQPPMVTTPQGR